MSRRLEDFKASALIKRNVYEFARKNYRESLIATGFFTDRNPHADERSAEEAARLAKWRSDLDAFPPEFFA